MITYDVSVFPGGQYQASAYWGEKGLPQPVYFEVGEGGYFDAWEQPQLFPEEVRAAFRSLR